MRLAMILAMIPLIAAAPPVPDDDALGRYAVKDASGRMLCQVEFRPGPSISGREAALKPGCGVAALKDVASWSYGDNGGFTLRGPLRETVATIVETEAGYVLRLPDDQRYDFEALDTQPALTPRERAIGRWAVYRPDVPGTAICHVQLSTNQRAVPDALCPPDIHAKLVGVWLSLDTELILTLPDKAKSRFRWMDAATLERPGLMLVRD